MELITKVINDLGNFIFIPLIFFVLMLLLKQPAKRAFTSSMKVGIGFISLNLVVGFMLEKMEPAIKSLAEKTGSSLSAVDVGGAATAVMGFGSSIGAIIIPLAICINVILLMLKLVDCVNVDVFNLHQNASMGAIVYAFSGNFLYGVLTAGLFHVIALIGADLSAKNNQDFYDLPDGVSISHPVANTYLLFAYPLNYIFDRLPFIKNLDASPKKIQERFGVLGESTTVGFLIGTILGLISSDWQDPYMAVISSVQLGMYLAAVMLLLPRMTSIMMEGLVPFSNAVRTKLVKKFPDRDITVGMDTALIIGDPAVIAPALFLIPVILILAVILPGNIVMPLGDLSQFVFFIACMVPIFKGNVIRTWLASILLFGPGLYIASWMTPATNEVYQRFGAAAQSNVMYTSLNPSANPFTGLFALASEIGLVAFIVIGVILILSAYYLKNKNKEGVKKWKKF